MAATGPGDSQRCVPPERDAPAGARRGAVARPALDTPRRVRDGRFRRVKLTYSGVMASAAMFVALGGTSYAVAKLPRNSVTTVQVKDRSLKTEDLAAGVLPAPAAAGPRGPRGGQGEAGPTGPRGPANAIIRRRTGAAVVGVEAKASADVATMKLPAGRWIVRYDTQAYFFPAAGANENDWFTCQLVVDGTPTGDGRDVLLGNGASAGGVGVITGDRVVRASGETKVVLRCWHPGALTPGGQTPGFRFTTLTAIESASIDEEDVTG